MKLIAGLLVSLLASIGTNRAMASPPHRVPVTDVRALYVPVGFDDNDEITVVLDGYLPDPCHKLRQASVASQPAGKTIVVSPMAEVVRGECPDMIVPFTQVVSLGTRSAGSYRIEVPGSEPAESLTVEIARTPGPDEFLYAAVDSAHFISSRGTKSARIRGRFTDSCQSMSEVRVIPTGKTIQVLPILQRVVTAGQTCERKDREFEVSVALPKLPPGRYLLHVRSLNGQAVNEVFSVGT